MKQQLKINEIFFSIQGESTRFGLPTVFIRTTGCHLRCTYCDTKYSYYEGNRRSIDDVIEEVKSYQARFVCVTGGEPLLQKPVYELMTRLSDDGMQVSLETAGDIDCAEVDPRVLKVIDIKTPDSGEAGRFSEKNLDSNPDNTEFKFVICSESDFDWAEEFCKKSSLHDKFTVLYSPSYGVVEEKWLAKKILSSRSRARLQLQLHKYIWSPDQRGI